MLKLQLQSSFLLVYCLVVLDLQEVQEVRRSRPDHIFLYTYQDILNKKIIDIDMSNLQR
jgi:methionyl-tRNA formyltransferase